MRSVTATAAAAATAVSSSSNISDKKIQRSWTVLARPAHINEVDSVTLLDKVIMLKALHRSQWREYIQERKCTLMD
jgi:hypothetical protein